MMSPEVAKLYAITAPLASTVRLAMLNAFRDTKEELDTNQLAERLGTDSLTFCRNQTLLMMRMGLFLRSGSGGPQGYQYRLNADHQAVKLFLAARRIA